MFQRTLTRRAVSPFSVFLKQIKNHPQLEGLSFLKRAKTVGKMYRGLSTYKLNQLNKIAENTNYVRRRKAPKKPRKAGPFARYIKKNFKKVRGTAPERISTLARRWREAKQKSKK